MAKKRKPKKTLAKTTPLIDRAEAKLLFSDEEVARLKLAILTGVDPSAKIEALRKLAFTGLDGAEKGALYLKAVTDADAAVRREAAGALQTLGMGADFADTLSTIASGTAKQKRLGLSKLKASAPALPEAERTIALAFLGSSLTFETDAEIRAEMLDALAAAVGTRGLPDGTVVTLVRAAIRVIAEDYGRAAGPGRAFFARLGHPDAAPVIWNEARSIEDRRLRMLLMGAIVAMPMAGTLRDEIAAAVARAVCEDEFEDLEVRDLRTAFTALGDAAIEALLPPAADAGEDRLPGLVALLDEAAVHASGEGRTKVLEFFLSAWGGAGRRARVSILEARIHHVNNVPAAVKQGIARHVIGSLHTFESRQRADLVWAALRRLGAPAIDALREAVERSPYPEEREAAARLIADIAEASGVDEAARVSLVGFFRGLENGERIPTGLAVRGAGRLAQGVRGDEALLADLIDNYRRRLGRVSYRGDMLVALCYASSSPASPPAAAGEMTMQILEFLGSDLPDPTYAETQGPEGRQIEIGRESGLYTDLIPDLLVGLQWLYVSPNLPEGLRAQATGLLLSLWKKIVDYEIVWAPGNLIQLASALAAMGAHSRGATRDLILEAMLGSIRNTGVVRAIVPMCGDGEERSDAYAKHMGAIATELFKMLGREEYRELGDRRAILITLGHVAGSARIGLDEPRSEDLRRRIVERIAEEGAPTSREMVQLDEWLRACPLISAEWKR